MVSWYNFYTHVATFCVGVMLYILLCGYPPFYADDEEELSEEVIKDKALHGELDFGGGNTLSLNYLALELWENISAEAKDLISKMLVMELNMSLLGYRFLKS